MMKNDLSVLIIGMFFLWSANILAQANRESTSFKSERESSNINIHPSSGALNYVIPLITLESKGVQLPLSLTYSYSGYKVSDVASRVGKGWQISGLGAVNRNLNGYPDDVSREVPDMPGGFEGGYLRNSRSTHGSWAEADLPYIANSKIDLVPDIYNYGGPGLSGTFTFKRGYNWLNPEILELPFTGNKINPVYIGNSIKGFNIFDINNRKYEYSEYEVSRIKPGNGCFPNDNDPPENGYPSYISTFISNWLLSSIKNSYREVAFSFDYLESNKITYLLPNPSLRTISGSYYSYVGCTDKYEYEKKEIEKIVFDNGYVEFETFLNDREDLTGHSALKHITVVKNGLIVMKVSFDYDYFNCCLTGPSKSLKLLGIKITNSQDEVISSYSFDYYEAIKPGLNANELAVGKDYWKFANGAFSNPYAIPYGTVDMEPSLQHLLHGTLIGVKDSLAGNSTVFVHELNDFSQYGDPSLSEVSVDDYPLGNRKGPGLRIAHIVNYDKNGNIYRKTYSYQKFDNPLLSSGILIDKPIHNVVFNSNGAYDINVYSSSVSAGTFSGESPILYTNIEIKSCAFVNNTWDCNSKNHEGRILRWYSFTPDEGIRDSEGYLMKPYLPMYRPSWARGNLVREVYLNFEGDSILKKINKFDRISTGKTLELGKVLAVDNIVPFSNFPGFRRIELNISGHRTWHEEKFRLESTEIIELNPIDNSELSTLTEYNYGNEFIINPTEITTTLSEGIILTERIKFVTDYEVAPSDFLPNDPLEYLYNIRDLNSEFSNWSNLPIEKASFIKKPGGQEKLAKSEIYKYDYAAGFMWPVLTHSIFTKLDQPISGYNMSEVDLNTNNEKYFKFNSNLFTEISLRTTKFNVKKQPIERQDEFGEYVSQLIDPNSGTLMATTKKGELKTSRYTSFEESISEIPYHGGWNPNEGNIVEATELDFAITGDKYYNLGIVDGNDGDFNSGTHANGFSGGKYLLSYWSKGNVITLYNNSGTEIESSSFTEGDWTYTEKIIEWNNSATDNFITMDSEANQDAFIDELRLHNIDATMETMGYYPDGKVTYKSSSSGDVITYEYDAKGRLEWILDRKRNVLEHHQYAEKDITDITSYNKHTVYTAKDENRTKDNIITAGALYVAKNVSFADGLGRFRQSIDFGVYPDYWKRVTFAEYDAFGRSLTKYLPYYFSSPQTDLGYIADAKSQQENYYLNQNDPNEVNTDPYTVKKVEPSPLQRPVEMGGIGEELQPGNGHSTEISYGWNTATDAIRKWQYHAPSAAASANSAYADNELRKKTIKDPDGRTISTFTDARGRKVASTVTAAVRLDNSGRAFTGNMGAGSALVEKNITSYTVYDDFDRVVFEVPAKAMEELEIVGNYTVRVSDNATHPTYQIVKDLVSTYSYDQEGRLWQKEMPGTGKQNFVYDHYDRVVMSRDNQQILNGQWNFVKYDTRGRVVLKGMSTISGHYSTHRDNIAIHFGTNGEFIKGETFESGGTLMGYTNTTYPVLTSAQQEGLTNVYYFDNYDFDLSEFNFIPFNGITTPLEVTRGLPTGSQTRILKSDGSLGDWLTTVTYYDTKKRPIQAFTENHLGGWDRVDTYYNAFGQVKKTIQYHRLTDTGSEHTLRTSYTYHYVTGKVQMIKCQIDDDSEVIVSNRVYDEKGLLKKLELHLVPGLQNYMQNINYRYNDQGQLTHINNTALIVDAFNNDDDDVFGQELTYFDASPEYYFPPPSTQFPHPVARQYGGNISSMMWNAKTPEEDGTMLRRHAYIYEYDDFNNLTHAKYGSDLPSDPGNFNVGLNDYNENLNYDLGGNIMKLKRNRAVTPESFPAPTQMDNLTYTYYNNGYAPKAINDSGEGGFTPARKHFVDNSSAAEQYLYDESGRLLEDKNKDVLMRYNLLGRPRQVWQSSYAAYDIKYTYDAAGNKLQKTTTSDDCDPLPCQSAIDKKDYVGNFIYENGELVMIYHPEGVIRPIDPTPENPREYAYDYFIKDYLGNVRVVLTEEDATITKKFLTTLEEVHRYIEEENFERVGETAEDLPTGYPVNGSVELNEKIALLSAANGTEIGPSIVLPVRRGDKVSLRTDYFYTEDAPGATYDNLNTLVNEVLLALIASGSNVLHLTEGQLIDMATGGNNYSNAISSFFSSNFDTTDVDKPHAYLVWMLYDNNMRLVPQGSGAKRVTNPNDLEELIEEEIPIVDNGYLHAYVTNGSAAAVSFDNFLITYIRGKTRQINHYYPYGLSIDGLDHSDEYLNKYTSKELQTGEFDSQSSSGLEMYDFHARFYDPQVGRWFTPDPAEQFHNPYLAMGNNPVMYVDPDGEFITWSTSADGFSIGFNLTPINIPLGAGLNFGSSSVGTYVEVGYRIGGTGATVSQSLDYDLNNGTWSTTSSAGVYASMGVATAGAGVHRTHDYESGQNNFGWSINAGVNWGNAETGMALSLSYGTGGFSAGAGGWYNSKAWDSNPEYAPDEWNKSLEITLKNNCYTYACNIPDGHLIGGLDPGYHTGDPVTYADLSLNTVLKSSLSDGLKKPNFFNKLGIGKRGHYEVYLVVDNSGANKDYHWYRQDKGGTWSHKRGMTPIINYDASGSKIYNPAKANRNYGDGLNYNDGGIILWKRTQP